MRRSTLILASAAAVGAVVLLRRRSAPFSSPLDPPNDAVSSGWGDDRAYRDGWHQGIDYPTALGTPVRAAGAGVVRSVRDEPDSVRGLWISIEHPDGYLSQYVHLAMSMVRPGQFVFRRQVIGASGRSGTRAGVRDGFGEHLHLTMRVPRALLAAYESAYGKPSTGYGSEAFGGVAVPAEPLIPARYQRGVIASAARLGVSVRQAG